MAKYKTCSEKVYSDIQSETDYTILTVIILHEQEQTVEKYLFIVTARQTNILSTVKDILVWVLIILCLH